MAHLGKGDWTDPERVRHFIQTYQKRYGDQFWNSLNQLIACQIREVIADFGCGPGIWLADAASRFNSIKVHGFDESEEMLKQAKEIIGNKFAAENIRLHLINLDKKRIPIEPETLDLAFCGYVLHELTDPNDFSSQVYSCLKQDGVFVVFDFVKTNEDLFAKIMLDVGMSEEQARSRYSHMCKHSILDIENILKTTGFKNITSDLLDVRAIVVGLKG